MANSPFQQAANWLLGNSKPCARFSTFEVLLAAMTSPDPAAYEPAFLCLATRYTSMAMRVKRKYPKLHDSEATEALDWVLATMRPRLRDGLVLIESEEHLTNYLRRGIEYLFISHTRKDRRMPLTYDPTEGFTVVGPGNQVEPDITQTLAMEAVGEALKAIPPDCQAKLLYVEQGFSYAEIADKLNILAESIKARVYQCRLKLKDKLLKLGITVDWPRSIPDKTANANPDDESYPDV